jgi:hypothetical protein
LRWSVLERQQRRAQQIRLRIVLGDPPLEARAAVAGDPEPIRLELEEAVDEDLAEHLAGAMPGHAPAVRRLRRLV